VSAPFPFAWWLSLAAATCAMVLVGIMPIRGFWTHALAATGAFIGVFVAAVILFNYYQIGV
jgi:hypothetical protein